MLSDARLWIKRDANGLLSMRSDSDAAEGRRVRCVQIGEEAK